MFIIDSHSGDKKLFKGHGRKGNNHMDDYQKMLLEAKRTNGFSHEKKQKPLTRKERKEYNLKNNIFLKGAK